MLKITALEKIRFHLLTRKFSRKLKIFEWTNEIYFCPFVKSVNTWWFQKKITFSVNIRSIGISDLSVKRSLEWNTSKCDTFLSAALQVRSRLRVAIESYSCDFISISMKIHVGLKKSLIPNKFSTFIFSKFFICYEIFLDLKKLWKKSFQNWVIKRVWPWKYPWVGVISNWQTQ